MSKTFLHSKKLNTQNIDNKQNNVFDLITFTPALNCFYVVM